MQRFNHLMHSLAQLVPRFGDVLDVAAFKSDSVVFVAVAFAGFGRGAVVINAAGRVQQHLPCHCSLFVERVVATEEGLLAYAVDCEGFVGWARWGFILFCRDNEHTE